MTNTDKAILAACTERIDQYRRAKVVVPFMGGCRWPNCTCKDLPGQIRAALRAVGVPTGPGETPAPDVDPSPETAEPGALSN